VLLIESDLATLNQDFAVMEQQRGRAAQHFFTKLLSDKLLLRRANGKVMGKAEFLQSLQMLSPFTQYTIEQLEIAQVPDAQKRVMVTLVMQTEDRYTIVRRFRHIRFFTQHPTGWRLEFWYVYEDVCA
jgi:hypothetical protein